jgi:hypothetical protein
MNPTITTRTLWRLDTDMLLASGAMEGPYTRAKPAVGWLYRLTGWFQIRRLT